MVGIETQLEAMAKGVVEGVWDKFSEKIVNSTAKKTKVALEKIKVGLGLAFETYLEKSYDKYSKAKTLLYHNKPQPIKEFFVVPTLKNGESILANNVNAVLGEEHFIILQGAGGIGKSTLMKHLFLSELKERDLIPILVELRDINDLPDDYKLTDVLFENLNYLEKSALLDETLEYSLNQGVFLFLLDGYDEINSEKSIGFLKKINKFCDKYPDNYIIISTRPEESDFIEFNRFAVLETCGFDKTQALEMISRLDYEETSKNRFYAALNKELYREHRSFASNPLLLTMMFLTYDEYAEIPKKIHLFYEKAFDVLFSRHDATKEGYKREIKSGLESDKFKAVFADFCCRTYYHGKLEFSYDEMIKTFNKINDKSYFGFDSSCFIQDLLDVVCMLVKDGSKYRFVHRSFQEYFTAVFLRDQFDDNMKNLGIKLIKKNISRIVGDNIFTMLGDMAKDKLDRNIILPLLEEIEEECIGLNKYDFYFKKFIRSVGFMFVVDRDSIKLSASFTSNLIPFISEALNLFIVRTEKILLAEKTLFAYIESNYQYNANYSNDSYYLPYELINNDNKLYELSKPTWIGERI